jgi:hypothetical protein
MEWWTLAINNFPSSPTSSGTVEEEEAHADVDRTEPRGRKSGL